MTDGKALRSAKARIYRDQKMIHEGSVTSLKRFTDDVREVATGFECGIVVANAKDVKEDDIIEFYTMEVK